MDRKAAEGKRALRDAMARKLNEGEPFIVQALLDLLGKGSAPFWKVLMPVMMALRSFQVCPEMKMMHLETLLHERLVPGLIGKTPTTALSLTGNRKGIEVTLGIAAGGYGRAPKVHRTFVVKLDPKGPMTVSEPEGDASAIQARIALS